MICPMLNWHTVSNFLSFLETPGNLCFDTKVFVHYLGVLPLVELSPLFGAASRTDFPPASGGLKFIEKIILVTVRNCRNSKRFIRIFQ